MINRSELNLVAENNANELYAQEFIFPLKLDIERMERLLIASFVNDPEYEAMEPQLFNDEINGKGLRILRYRKDKKVDVYWQPGVFVDRESFNVGAGLADFEEVEINPAVFEIDKVGVKVDFAFTDKQGRRVSMSIRENTNNSSRLSFLAPVGHEIENPKQFFLAYMLDFDFVRRRRTCISATIGSRELKPASFPLLRDFKRVYFIRYSAKPSVGILNSPMKSPLLFKVNSPGTYSVEGMKITVNSSSRIETVSSSYRDILFELEFLEGFPNLNNMKSGDKDCINWLFKISGDTITGGVINLNKKEQIVEMEIDVRKSWQPVSLPLSLNLFTRVLRFFRQWPASYIWQGSVECKPEPKMNGIWKRKKM